MSSTSSRLSEDTGAYVVAGGESGPGGLSERICKVPLKLKHLHPSASAKPHGRRQLEIRVADKTDCLSACRRPWALAASFPSHSRQRRYWAWLGTSDTPDQHGTTSPRHTICADPVADKTPKIVPEKCGFAALPVERPGVRNKLSAASEHHVGKQVGA